MKLNRLYAKPSLKYSIIRPSQYETCFRYVLLHKRSSGNGKSLLLKNIVGLRSSAQQTYKVFEDRIGFSPWLRHFIKKPFE